MNAKLRQISLADIFLSIVKSSVIVFVCIGLQYVSSFYAMFISEKVEFIREGNTWSGNISSLKNDSYYLSVGRPRGLCNLYFGDKLLDSTVASNGVSRESLLFGASFEKNSNSASVLTIKCKTEGGFSVSLMHPPVVAKYQAGICLQFLRSLTELALGPLFSFMLLLFLTMMAFGQRVNLKARVEEGNISTYLLFAFVAFLYSISLAYYTRIFIDGFYASLLHVVLRTAFNISLLMVVGQYSRQRPWLLGFLAIICVTEVVTGLRYPELLDRFDDFSVTILPVVTFCYLMDIHRLDNRTRIMTGVIYIIASRLLLQLIDVGIVWFNVGVYTAPSSLAVITMMVLVLKNIDDQLKSKIASLSKEVISLIESNKRVQDQISDLARLAFRETSFSRFSAYVDSFSLGKSDKPYESMIRVVEHGYKKSTESDRIVLFKEMRGVKMKSALDAGKVILSSSEVDGTEYIIVPLGKHACLNLSNDTRKPNYQALESFETLKDIHLVSNSINNKLVEYGLKQGAALQKLRSKRGDGTWQEEFGVIFVDINEYSTLTERYGNVFGEFISATYLPALCKVVGSWAVRESSRGDEVYLVSIKDMIGTEVSPTEAVFKSIDAIKTFASVEGKALCLQSGFVPVTMSVAAGIGAGSIVCDALEVRTTGEIINETHRLLSAAPSGAIVMHSNLVARVHDDDPQFKGTETPVLIKKNFIIARTLDERISA